MKNLIVALIVGIVALFCVKCNASDEPGVDETGLIFQPRRAAWIASQRKGNAPFFRWLPGDYFRGRGIRKSATVETSTPIPTPPETPPPGSENDPDYRAQDIQNPDGSMTTYPAPIFLRAIKPGGSIPLMTFKPKDFDESKAKRQPVDIDDNGIVTPKKETAE